MNKAEFKRAFKDTIPVMTGYIVMGMGFGVLLAKIGYGFWWALGMSIFMFAGSMQYMAVELLAGGVSLITAAITTLMVNARHLFYGISLIDKYKVLKKEKPYVMFGLTDETYSLVCSYKEEDPKLRRQYYVTVTLLDHIYWITGCVTGNLLGTLVEFNSKGIDFALTALFVTIVVDQWLHEKEHRAAIMGGASSILCLVIFGENLLIPSMVCITICLTVMRHFDRKGEEENV